MNPLDQSIIQFLNQFAQKSKLFDDLNVVFSDNQLLTLALIVAIFWWAWFHNEGNNRENRQIIISSLVLCTAAIFVARTLALTLPYRERPLRNPLLRFRLPFGVNPNTLIRWSSFPSDHAVFLFALATSVFFLSRKLGIAVFCYALLICSSLVYSGIHYPTDILAGAALGTGIASLTQIKPLRARLSSKPLAWAGRSPASFYPSFYLTTFLFGTMFDSLRGIAAAAWRASRTLMHH
jgi:undecaprenyl-diphosphatase